MKTLVKVKFNMFKFFETVSQKINSYTIVRIIQRSVTILIPFLMIGSFSLIINTFPIHQYQIFLNTGAGNIVREFATAIFNITFNNMSIYMSIAIGYCFACTYSNDMYYIFGTVLSSLSGFLISVGSFTDSFRSSYHGVSGMFMAIIASLAGSVFYKTLYLKKKSKINLKVYTEGANYTYNSALFAIIPLLTVIVCFLIVQYITTQIFKVNCLQELFVLLLNKLFNSIRSSFTQGLLFVIITSLLWMFGIHGSDVLNTVSEGVFTSYINQNIKDVCNGGVATHIVSKTFIDVFVLMGGCGVAICLLIAIFIFAKQSNNRKLAKTACIPIIFNINELMIFGLPVIYSPVLLIPFLITPVITFLTSYASVAIGIVPVPSVIVEWTTPVMLSGYIATGSIAGSLLQLFNIVIGVLIYAPFIKLKEKQQLENSKSSLEKLMKVMKSAEENNNSLKLDKVSGELNSTIKMLMLDFSNALKSGKLKVFYQPQFDKKMDCIGAEALLRWNHNLLGSIYPPLIIKLAEETGLLFDLEEYIVRQVASDCNDMSINNMDNFHISVNLTADTIQNPNMLNLLQEISKSDNFKKNLICIEITEQSALQFGKSVSDTFRAIHESGFLLAVDDFSMGHTSIKYLQDNEFDFVKIDGSLIKEMSNNERCKDIIKSIVYLSKSLGFFVLAEFVETTDEMNDLMETGCEHFQGWLFSPAITFEQFKTFLCNNKKPKNVFALNSKED